MDPLSIATAIMAFLASTYTICLRVEQFIEIPSSVRKLKRAIQQFECELESLSRQSANPKVANHLRKDYVQDLIAKAQKDLETLQSTVSEVTRLRESQSKVRRFKWVCNNKKCEELRSSLEEAINNLERLTALAFRYVRILSPTRKALC
jgi:valyl-tRNA synthetase